MKIQIYLILLLTFVFSSDLSAVRTAKTLDKLKTTEATNIKKHPIKKKFRNITQRILENKIIKKFNKKSAKTKADKKISPGLLSLIFSIGSILIIFLSTNLILSLYGILLGVAGFIFGIIGLDKWDRRGMSVIGIILGSFSALALIGLGFLSI